MRVEPVIAEHLRSVMQKLRDCGCVLEIDDVGITITPGDLRAVDVTTQPFPGFPTDLQAPFMALMATAQGTSVVSEKIYENRLQHVAELQRMGASIRLDGSTAIVEGFPALGGAPVTGSDLEPLRHGAGWIGCNGFHEVYGRPPGPRLRRHGPTARCRSKVDVKATNAQAAPYNRITGRAELVADSTQNRAPSGMWVQVPPLPLQS